MDTAVAGPLTWIQEDEQHQEGEEQEEHSGEQPLPHPPAYTGADAGRFIQGDPEIARIFTCFNKAINTHQTNTNYTIPK